MGMIVANALLLGAVLFALFKKNLPSWAITAILISVVVIYFFAAFRFINGVGK